MFSGQNGCINTFGGNLNWYPMSFNPRKIFHIGRGRGMSHRSCKQACINEGKRNCQGVYYDSYNEVCYGLLQIDKSNFRTKQNLRYNFVNLRKCKKQITENV